MQKKKIRKYGKSIIFLMIVFFINIDISIFVIEFLKVYSGLYYAYFYYSIFSAYFLLFLINFSIVSFLFFIIELFFSNIIKKTGIDKVNNLIVVFFPLQVLLLSSSYLSKPIYFIILVPFFLLTTELCFIKLISSHKKRLYILIITSLMFFVLFCVSSYIIRNNSHKEIFYGITGEIIQKQIAGGHVSNFDYNLESMEGLDRAKDLCIENAPNEKCDFIRFSFSTRRTDDGQKIKCHSCVEEVINCVYGCPKNFESD
ncbi:MAG: hypothetical protein KAU07_00670 [Candidatus Andersenbacteria bacterium]|nr:hypothetical protein [Candidatus Andersenbacteria bacterium]